MNPTHLTGPSERSLHGHGVDEPTGFSHSQWILARDELYHSGDPKMKLLGALMNKIQHHYMELPSFVATEARKFAECATAILIGEPKLSCTLSEAIQKVAGASERNQLNTLGNEQHLGQRDLSTRLDAVAAVYMLACHIKQSIPSHPPPAPPEQPNAPKPDLMQLVVDIGLERHAATLASEGICTVRDFQYLETDEELPELMDACGFKTIEKRKFKHAIEQARQQQEEARQEAEQEAARQEAARQEAARQEAARQEVEMRSKYLYQFAAKLYFSTVMVSRMHQQLYITILILTVIVTLVLNVD
jgi:hypothetical protein